MSRYYKFKKDLKAGQLVEKAFCKLLKEKYNAKETQTHNTSSFDVSAKFGREWVTFEVKHDKKAPKTGNIAIEYRCRGRPSGIEVTQAKWWITKIWGKWYYMEVKDLKEMIAQKKYKYTVSGGDEEASRMYLFSRKEFIGKCQRL